MLEFLIDRVATPIGELIVVADGDGNLRTIDWTDHEARMRQLLDRSYGKGGYTIEAARDPGGLTRAMRAYFKGDIGVIEVNEAFASVALQFLRDAGLQERAADVNPNGGGISLGHPLGATGARITATLLGELERRHARYGLATMCIGFGQAIAAVIERL